MPGSVSKPAVTKVLLINQEKVPHYRVAVYNRLSEYLKNENFALTVASGGIQDGSTYPVEFDLRAAPLSFLRLAKLMFEIKPDILIFWVGLKSLYLYPILFLAKLLGKQTIHWGHGSDLLRPKGLGLTLRTFAYNIDFRMASAIILYAEHLKKNVKRKFQNKIFVANNTLAFDYSPGAQFDKARCLSKYTTGGCGQLFAVADGRSGKWPASGSLRPKCSPMRVRPHSIPDTWRFALQLLLTKSVIFFVRTPRFTSNSVMPSCERAIRKIPSPSCISA